MAKTKPEPKPENKPAVVFAARGVKVAVFANESEKGTWYKASIQRVYKQDNEWKTSSSLSVHDVPVALQLLGKAYDWMLQAERKEDFE